MSGDLFGGVKALEQHGLSVFFGMDDDVFHSYSVYARGCESLSNSYGLLDQTPYGRAAGL